LSHLKERKEKNCLNCNAQVQGKYCHICGQENIETKESVWHLVLHFFNDITHFDGKFFSSLKYLITKPGFLPKEYLRGRRMSYLNPIRMYVFTSAIFFIVFFSVFKMDEHKIKEGLDNIQRESKLNGLQYNYALTTGEIRVEVILVGNVNEPDKINRKVIDSLTKLKAKQKDKDSNTVKRPEKDTADFALSFSDKEYGSKKQYDSIQLSLPAGKRDGWFKKTFIYKDFELKERYGTDNQAVVLSRITDKFLHNIPSLLFLSLPFFGLFLKMLYYRKREVYYVNHGIFSIHYYIFCFIILLFYFGISRLSNFFPWAIWGWLKAIIWISIFFYLYKAMRNFYEQRRAKTIFKFVLLCLLLFFLLMILFSVFFLFSALNV
jgi:hypothetical protein